MIMHITGHASPKMLKKYIEADTLEVNTSANPIRNYEKIKIAVTFS